MFERVIEFTANHPLLIGMLLALIVVYVFISIKASGLSLSPNILTLMFNKDEAVLLDIRAHKDFANGHIVGSFNIPYEKLQDRVVELEKHRQKTIIIIDQIGQYSSLAVEILNKHNFTTARLSGGISSWQADNLPLAKHS